MSLSMDDRDGFIWLDGKLVPWRDSRMHVLTHALHYGSAVFEGERIYDGRVFRLAAHSARLINSARLLDYEIPWTHAEIAEATRAVVKANGPFNQRGLISVMNTATPTARGTAIRSARSEDTRVP